MPHEKMTSDDLWDLYKRFSKGKEVPDREWLVTEKLLTKFMRVDPKHNEVFLTLKGKK